MRERADKEKKEATGDGYLPIYSNVRLYAFYPGFIGLVGPLILL